MAGSYTFSGYVMTVWKKVSGFNQLTSERCTILPPFQLQRSRLNKELIQPSGSLLVRQLEILAKGEAKGTEVWLSSTYSLGSSSSSFVEDDVDVDGMLLVVDMM